MSNNIYFVKNQSQKFMPEVPLSSMGIIIDNNRIQFLSKDFIGIVNIPYNLPIYEFDWNNEWFKEHFLEIRNDELYNILKDITTKERTLDISDEYWQKFKKDNSSKITTVFKNNRNNKTKKRKKVVIYL